ncbi:hypothetical protein BX600DRAFT_439583 [Xylariales sp. PMI_506]|nr:hypothetical protein BX600DRAFT_439583 [Xylariales sp. PMI_506]
MSRDLKYKPRTAEQRAADALMYEPKHARERRVNSILTARYLKAKSAFDTYFKYDIDSAFNETDGSWRDESDPWLRITDTLPEFLQGYTETRLASGQVVTGDELESMASALLRISKEQLEGAGRDSKVLDQAFRATVLEDVTKLKAQHHLPQAADLMEDDEEEDDDEDAEK